MTKTLEQPVGCANQPGSKQSNIKSQAPSSLIHCLFLFCEEVKEKRAKALLLQHPCDISVSRAMTAAPTPMGKQHHSGLAAGDIEVALQALRANRNFDRLLLTMVVSYDGMQKSSPPRLFRLQLWILVKESFYPVHHH